MALPDYLCVVDCRAVFGEAWDLFDDADVSILGATAGAGLGSAAELRHALQRNVVLARRPARQESHHHHHHGHAPAHQNNLAKMILLALD